MTATDPTGFGQLARLLARLHSQQGQQPSPDPLERLRANLVEQLRASLERLDNPGTGDAGTIGLGAGLSPESAILESLGGLGDLGVSRASTPAPIVPAPIVPAPTIPAAHSSPASAKRSGVLSKIAKGLGSVGKGAEDYREDRTGDERQSKGVLGAVGRGLIPALQIVAGIALRDADTTAREQYNQSVFAGEQLRTQRGQTRRARELQKTLAQQRIDAQSASQQLRALQIQLQLSRLSFDQRQKLREAVLEDFSNAGFSGGKFEDLFNAPEMQVMVKELELSKQTLLGAFKAGPAKLSKRVTAEQKLQEVETALGRKLTDAESQRLFSVDPPAGRITAAERRAQVEEAIGRKLTDEEAAQFFHIRISPSTLPTLQQKLDRQGALGKSKIQQLLTIPGGEEVYLRLNRSPGGQRALERFAISGKLTDLAKFDISVGEILQSASAAQIFTPGFEDLDQTRRMAEAQGVFESPASGFFPKVRTAESPYRIFGYEMPFGTQTDSMALPADKQAAIRTVSGFLQQGVGDTALNTRMLVQTLTEEGEEAPAVIAPVLDLAAAQGPPEGNSEISVEGGKVMFYGAVFVKVDGKWVKQ